MTIRLRTAFLIGIGVLALWFLYVQREILAPFILAGIFAYIFNPFVNFISHRTRLPRTLSVIIIYLLIVGVIVILSIFVTKRILEESDELRIYINTVVQTTRHEVNTLPDWIRPVTEEMLTSLQESKILSVSSVFGLFPKAISRIISFLIFLFSGFYFLKEGRRIFDSFMRFVPNEYKIEGEILIRKINSVVGRYLRGILLLIFIVSLMTFIALSILGIRFALILAIFTGFAEIVPFIGPITATAVAALVALVNGSSNFSIAPIQAALIVIVIYFALRQLQDYFISPYVIGRFVGLHPLVILFAVIAGGHIWGALGFILGVPIAATLKILLEFSLDKINEQSNKKSLGRE